MRHTFHAVDHGGMCIANEIRVECRAHIKNKYFIYARAAAAAARNLETLKSIKIVISVGTHMCARARARQLNRANCICAVLAHHILPIN